MIITGSRYTAGTETANNAARAVANVVRNYSYDKTTTVIAKEGDTFEAMAGLYLSDSTQYWKIAMLNPSVWFPDKIPAGTVVKVPIL